MLVKIWNRPWMLLCIKKKYNRSLCLFPESETKIDENIFEY